MLIEPSSISFNSSFISGSTEDKSPHSLCSLALLVASAWAAELSALLTTIGTAVTVNVNVCVVDDVALVAVIVYAVAAAISFGVPVSNPVVVLKVKPVGAAGEIEYEAIAPPVDEMV